MRPGLSGWAQVCAPYASSIDDSDLKLSMTFIICAISVVCSTLLFFFVPLRHPKGR